MGIMCKRGQESHDVSEERDISGRLAQGQTEGGAVRELGTTISMTAFHPHYSAVTITNHKLKMRTAPKGTHTSMFMVALLIITKIQKQPNCSSTEEWIKMGYIQDTRTSMFKAALFTIAKTRKQPKCPSTEERIKMCHIHTMEDQSVIKKERNDAICSDMDGPRGSLRWLSGKESTCQCRRCRFDPWVRKIPWRKK